MDKEKLMDKDLYDLLDIPQTSDFQAIRKAYRKKALTCHPDKHPDNPEAVVRFLELSTALEILGSDSSRASYDARYNRKKANERKNSLLDARRKKFKEDLEARERAAELDKKQKTENKYSYGDMLNEIERLRKEGSRWLIEEMERMRKEFVQKEQSVKERLSDSYSYAYSFANQAKSSIDPNKRRLKIKWNPSQIVNGGPTENNLMELFSKYGKVEIIVVSKKKKGSAIVEFENANDALSAYQTEMCVGNILTITLIDSDNKFSGLKQPPTKQPSSTSTSFTYSSGKPLSNPSFLDISKFQKKAEDDFEEQVLNKLRQAEAQKRKLADAEN